MNKQALALLEKSVEESPDYAPAWKELAQREYSEYRYADGGKTAEQRWLSDLNRALELDLGNVEVSAALVVHHVETGQNREAFLMASDLVRHRPDNLLLTFRWPTCFDTPVSYRSQRRNVTQVSPSARLVCVPAP